jgi:hypothetical protein
VIAALLLHPQVALTIGGEVCQAEVGTRRGLPERKIRKLRIMKPNELQQFHMPSNPELDDCIKVCSKLAGDSYDIMTTK